MQVAMEMGLTVRLQWRTSAVRINSVSNCGDGLSPEGLEEELC